MPQVEEKKERKKRSHDPNAPKRPLTPYFLYMQTARPIIATDLGADAPKGAVQEEGQRRWGSMSHKDKDVSHPAAMRPQGILVACTNSSSRAGTKRTSTTCVSTTLVFTRTSVAMPSPSS